MIHDWTLFVNRPDRKSQVTNYKSKSRIKNQELLSPAAAERAIEVHDGGELLLPKAREVELALEQVALGVEDLEVAVDSALVPLGRQPRRRAQRVDEPRLLDALFAPLLILRERIRDLAERRI